MSTAQTRAAMASLSLASPSACMSRLTWFSIARRLTPS
jgi:hypothetical protein